MSKWFKMSEKIPPMNTPVWLQLTTPSYYDKMSDCQVTEKTEIVAGIRRESKYTDTGYTYSVTMMDGGFDLEDVVTVWEWGEKTIIDGWQKMTIPKPMEV